MIDPADYPRPQLRREAWTDLNGRWQFAYDDADVGLSDGWNRRADVFDRTILVPFPPESRASGVHDTGFHPILWYRRTFDVAPEARPERLLLHFGAVDYRAKVWVNGRLAAEHEGGHTPFSADITTLLEPGAAQTVVVRVLDDPHDLAQPRGKQYWEEEPGLIWYHRTSGIWQRVWLEPVAATAIAELRWTPDLDAIGVGLRLRLNRQPAGSLQVRLVLSIDGECVADDTYRISKFELARHIRLDCDALARHRIAFTWAPHHPNLVDAVIELIDGADGAILDRVESYFGLRGIEAQDGRLLLNGVPTFMRLVLAQNYWPDTLLAAADSQTLKREVELIKSLGFNGVRIHQKIEDPRFLYWCDKLGLMVWGEAANAYIFDDRATDRLTREWLEAVRRDYNHPCIVAWVPLNESWGVPNLANDPSQRAFVKALYHLTKALDPSRPIIGNDGWQHAVGDIFGIHDYATDADTLRERYGSRAALERTFTEIRPAHHALLLTDDRRLGAEPVVVSEFGGLSITPAAGEKWHGYASYADADAVLASYAALVGALLSSTAIAGFCYTQLADTEQETNGLLTADRQPKLDPAAVRKINVQPSKAIPTEVLDAIINHEVEQHRVKKRRSGGGQPALAR